MLKPNKTGAAAGAILLAMFVTTLPSRAQSPATGSQTAPPGQPAATGQTGQPAPGAPHQKQVKDQTEYDLYNTALKDIQSQNFSKALTDLETWKQKYPESDFKDDREVYFIQAYAGSNQQAKAVDQAGELMNRDLTKVFSDPKTGPQMIVKVLFTTVVAAQQIPNPTPEQIATAEKAAHMLQDYNTKPEGASDADWAKAREQMQGAAKTALLYFAMKPGIDAMQKKDYPAAEAAFTKAQQQNPDSGQIAYQLGASEVAQQATDPNKVSMGIYEIARGAALDPSKGGIADPKARAEVEAYLKKIYTSWHGSDEGLDQLKQQALSSPTPPAGFHIKTATEISNEREAEFEKTNPQLALWMKIKAQLSDANGEQYFQGQLKDAQVPQLRGVVVDAKPACHSKELVVAVPVPATEATPQQAAHAAETPRPEITLKLDAPLSGKPEMNADFHWEGVPVAFTKDPFMLTMTVEKSKIEGLKVTPCAAAPAHAPAHRPATKKK